MQSGAPGKTGAPSFLSRWSQSRTLMVPALKHKALQEKGWRQAPALQRNKSTSSFRTVAAYRQRSRRHHSHAVRSLTLAQARQDREGLPLPLNPSSLGVLGALHASMLFRSALRLPRSWSVPRSKLSLLSLARSPSFASITQRSTKLQGKLVSCFLGTLCVFA